MKTIRLIFAAVTMVAISTSAFGQTVNTKAVATGKTETLTVKGNCDMCKARIEKAAKLDGVTKAEWDKTTKLLTVSYDPSKTNMDAVSNKVVAVGHDTDKGKADDKVYSALPGCCKYDR